jgi:hypothetical protein
MSQGAWRTFMNNAPLKTRIYVADFPLTVAVGRHSLRQCVTFLHLGDER